MKPNRSDNKLSLIKGGLNPVHMRLPKLSPRVRLNLGTVGYDHKPTEREVCQVVADLAREEARREVSLQELMRFVACEGRPFTPALLATPKADGSFAKSNACFTSQQIFALDFDNNGQGKISLETTLERAAELDLVPFGAYQSPSSTTEWPRYRILFCLERPATNERERQIIVQMLMDLFPAADSSCKDACRHFYGVTSGPVAHRHIQPGATNSISAVALAWQADKGRDKSNCSAKIKRFARHYGLTLKSCHLVLADSAPAKINIKCNENRATSIVNKIELATNSLLSHDQEEAEECTLESAGGGYDGEFFRFDVSLEDYLAGKVKAQRKEPVPAVEAANRTERRVRWGRVKYQLQECQLIQTLLQNPDPDQPLDHGEFFHLATHFAKMRGGDEEFEAALKQMDHNTEGRIRQYRALSEAYLPQHCVNSTCRHKDRCTFFRMPHHKNIFSIKFVRGQVRQTSETFTISREKARELLPTYYEQALASKKHVSIIRADCGAGKTFSMIGSMLEQVRSGKKVIYAAPTHRLLNETYTNLLSVVGADVKIYRWPDLLPYISRDEPRLAAEIHFYWRTGHYDWAATERWNWAYRQAKANGYFGQNRAKLDARARDILDYLEAKDNEDKEEPALWLMTHAKLVNSSATKANLCFIDEDILLKTLLTVRQCRYSDLNRILSGLQAYACNPGNEKKDRDDAERSASAMIKLMQTVFAVEKNLVAQMPEMDFPSARILRKASPTAAGCCLDSEDAENAGSDPLEFLSSRAVAFVKPDKAESAADDSIVYVSRRRLPWGVGKYVIASASASQRLYEEFLGEVNTEFVSMPRIEYEGELVLHPKKSFANCSLSGAVKQKTLAAVQEILGEFPGAGVIGSKKLKNALPAELKSRVICTFGATEGLNAYEGRDLVVIGALHRPDFVYKLLAVALGHRLGIDTTLELNYRPIKRNGFDFHAVAFDDELLREIQFALIETELEQAVGRARLVSNACRVDLFTNIPLPQCRIAS